MYLYMKTIERAHMPNKLWQKIRLSKNYAKALAQLDEHLEHWPQFLVHKNKQRLTKITQYLIRMRRLALRSREKTVTLPTRKKRVDNIREARAESAANLERTIEEELLGRLQSGTYGDIYNFPMQSYAKVLDKEEVSDEEREALEEFEKEEEAALEKGDVAPYVEGDEDSSDEDSDSDDEGGEVEYLDDVSFDEEEEDLEDLVGGDDDEDEGSEGSEGEAAARGKKRGRRGDEKGTKGKGKGKGRKNIELEYEMEGGRVAQRG